MKDAYHFHIGYYDQLHPEPSINFQMNRWINYLGESALADMQNIAPRLLDFPSYRREFLALAEKALFEKRNRNAAYYFRSAEFFMQQDDPHKIPTRQKFLSLMWKSYVIKVNDCHVVPYHDENVKGFLPAYRFTHPKPKDTIVIHGGFDSYIEEFFPVILHLRDAGYTIICFEGPGQGGALQDSHLLLTQEWHKPVSTILDYFDLQHVTLLGISMGGCLALRAAAFEPRVRRVISYDVFYDWIDTTMQKMKPIAPLLTLLLDLRAKRAFNNFLAGIMKQNPLFDWAMHQAMLVLGVCTSYEVFLQSRKYTTRDISPLIKQDVLLMAGSEDHIIPLNHFHRQVAALQNVRSKTSRLFTREEQAQNHCQIGNLGLAVKTITDWIDHAR